MIIELLGELKRAAYFSGRRTLDGTKRDRLEDGRTGGVIGGLIGGERRLEG